MRGESGEGGAGGRGPSDRGLGGCVGGGSDVRHGAMSHVGSWGP